MAETPAAENRLEGHKVIAFAKNVDLVPQQKKSRLVMHVDADMAWTEPGDRYTDEQMGLSDPVEVLEDYGDTPGGVISKHRRIGFFKTYEDGKWIGTREKAEQLVDPTNPTVQAMGAGRERRRDKTIIKGFFDPAWEMDKDGDPVKKNFPAGQIVAVNDWTYWKGKADGSGSAPSSDSPLTVAKLRKARVMRSKSELDEMGLGYWCIGYEEEDLQNLLTSVEVSSTDYNAVRALIDGERDVYQGFKWIPLNAGRLPYSAANTTAEIPVWHTHSLKYKERPLTSTRIQERADKRYRWHAYYESQDSVLRRDDKAVIKILCKR